MFCLVPGCSGARIFEMLALTPSSIDIESRVRQHHDLQASASSAKCHCRATIVGDLNRVFRLRFTQRDPFLANPRVWTWSRTTAWRHIKA
jgi:hypothetical protein